MSLYRKIEKQIEKFAAEFCGQIATKYNLSEAELIDLWREVAGAKNKSLKKPRKNSGFQAFSREARPSIKAENPDLAFGDISREIGRRWRALSEAEKAAYEPSADKISGASSPPSSGSKSPVSPDDAAMAASSAPPSPSPAKKKNKKKNKKASTPVAPNSPVVATVPTTASPVAAEGGNECPYDKMSLKDLKRLCKEKGLEIRGATKKNLLIEVLRRADATSSPSKPDEAVGGSPGLADDDDVSSTYSDLLGGETEEI